MVLVLHVINGIHIEENLAYEYNKITILLDNNIRNSCTSNNQHINKRYFGVKDRLYSGNITMDYCPTDEILSDFFKTTERCTV